MAPVSGIDHVVINATDLEATCAFYDRLFGIRTHAEYAKDGKVLVRQVAIGGAVLSIHQQGNGVELVAEDSLERGLEPDRSAHDLVEHHGIDRRPIAVQRFENRAQAKACAVGSGFGLSANVLR